MAGQRKNLQTSSRSNPVVRGNPTSSNYTAVNSESQPSASHAFSYQPPIPSPTATVSSPFSIPPAVQTLPTLMKLDSSSRPRSPLNEAKKNNFENRAVYSITTALILWTPLAPKLLCSFQQNAWKKVKNGRQPSKLVMGYMNTLWCHLDLPTPPALFKTISMTLCKII